MIKPFTKYTTLYWPAVLGERNLFFFISHAFRLYVLTAIEEEDFASKSTWHRNVIELKAEQFHKKNNAKQMIKYFMMIK